MSFVRKRNKSPQKLFGSLRQIFFAPREMIVLSSGIVYAIQAEKPACSGVKIKSTSEIIIKDTTPLEFEWKIQKKCKDTESTYQEFEKLKKLKDSFIRQFTVILSEKNEKSNYMELTTAKVPYDADSLQATVDLIRETAFKNKEVTLEFEYKTLLFISGLQFKEWVDLNKYDMSEIQEEGNIKQ